MAAVLGDRRHDDMMVRNLSPATQSMRLQSSGDISTVLRIGWVWRTCGLTSFAIAQKRSWSYINQVACALRFFSGATLGLAL